MPKTYKQLFVETRASQYTNDDQWLAPASHDKKMLDTLGNVLVHDVADYEEENFSAGKNMKKDTSKARHTTSAGNPEMPTVKEDTDDVTYSYQDDCYNLIDEINDLLDSVASTNVQYYKYQETSAFLRSARDKLLHALPRTDEAIENEYGNMSTPVSTGEGVSESLRNALTEVSKGKLKNYLQRAITDHGMANFAKRSTEGQPGKEKEAKHWKTKEAARKKGISTAIDKLNEDFLVESLKEPITEVSKGKLKNYIKHAKASVDELKQDRSDDRAAAKIHLGTENYKNYNDSADKTTKKIQKRVSGIKSAEKKSLTEAALKAGPLKLNDGTTVRLTVSSAKSLNRMMESTKDHKGMMSTLMKNKEEFNEMVKFSQDLKEEFGGLNESDEISTSDYSSYCLNLMTVGDLMKKYKRSKSKIMGEIHLHADAHKKGVLHYKRLFGTTPPKNLHSTRDSQ